MGFRLNEFISYFVRVNQFIEMTILSNFKQVKERSKGDIKNGK
jgi:hypothetical protein